MMDKEMIFLITGTFAFSTLLFIVITHLFNRKSQKMIERLEFFFPKKDLGKERGKAKNAKKALEKIDSLFEDANFVAKWGTRLDEAGIPLLPGEFLLLRVVSTIAVVILMVFLGYINYFLLVGGLLGFFIPVILLKWKRKHRLKKCSVQLSEALGTMANSMRAGFSFIQSMQLIGKEMPDPIGPEFERTLKEINLGVSMEDAFTNLLKRLPEKDLELVVNALLIQRTSGGNLASLLETMQETIRGRFRIKEELNTLTAQGRMSGIVISLLPVGLGTYLYVMNPEFILPFIQHPIGWVLIGGACFSGLIGWFVIQKIVRIEV